MKSHHIFIFTYLEQYIPLILGFSHGPEHVFKVYDTPVVDHYIHVIPLQPRFQWPIKFKYSYDFIIIF